MLTAPLRLRRALSRFLGTFLAVLSVSGQIALTVHNHPVSLRRDARPALSRQDEDGVEPPCRLCAMSLQSRVAHAPKTALRIALAVVGAVVPTPVETFGRTPVLRASSRAPPAA